MIRQGTYGEYEGEKFVGGCTVGCYASHLTGVDEKQRFIAATYALPLRLIGIADAVFEMLHADKAAAWHTEWVDLIPVGVPMAAMERACDRMILRATELKAELYGARRNKHLMTAAALYRRRIAGDEPAEAEWQNAARAARGAWDALAARGALEARGAWDALAARGALAALATLAALAAPPSYVAALVHHYALVMREAANG
jgi:hypothetical protein